MASVDECRTAIAALAAKLGGDQRASGFDRTVSAEVTDLGLTFYGHLTAGKIDDITAHTAQEVAAKEPAQIRLAMTGDDLVALAAGQLSLATSWLNGRVKVLASLPDLLRLRSMM